MGIFVRGSTLWMRYRDVDGTWRNASTMYRVGDEARAQKALEEVEARVAASRTPASVAQSSTFTVRAFAEKWIAARDTGTKNDDQGRLDNHILPALGHIPLAELRPRHVRDFVEKLKTTKKKRQARKDGTLVGEEENIAPRTVLHIYGTLRSMLNDAVADELILSSPCILKDELPARKDKDRSWRRTAVFTRDEVLTIISAKPNEIPDDRRVMYAIMFLGAMRFGEAAAVTWRDYDAAATPLGKLVVEKSYSSKLKTVKATKTDNPREMPVHPTLARILAEWKLEGFARYMGRNPKPEDLVVPSRHRRPRNVNHMLRRFHEDLERVGLRARRQHDARRTFISIARADGARPDILRWATHGPTGDIVDDYTTLPWATLCEEVAKVRVSVLEGKVISLPFAATGTTGSSDTREQLEPIPLRETAVIRQQVPGIEVFEAETTEGSAAESPVTAKPADPQKARYTTRYTGLTLRNEQSKWRSGRDSNPSLAIEINQQDREPAMTPMGCRTGGSRLVSLRPPTFHAVRQHPGSKLSCGNHPVRTRESQVCCHRTGRDDFPGRKSAAIFLVLPRCCHVLPRGHDFFFLLDVAFVALLLSRLVSATRRSKSLSKSRSCTMRYFSNSLSAWARAISAVTFPASCKTSRSVAARKRFNRVSQSCMVMGSLRIAMSSATSRYAFTSRESCASSASVR